MSRIDENEEFLDKIVKTSAKTRIKLISKASDEEIKTLFEIFLNSNSLSLTKKEEKSLNKHLKILKTFLNKRWDIKALRNFFLKNASVCSSITAIVLNKILEGNVCGFLVNNGD